VDKELWPNKDRFEKKDYALTEETMRKAGDLGFLSVAVQNLRRNGYGICKHRFSL
jgi:hypothetical protein